MQVALAIEPAHRLGVGASLVAQTASGARSPENSGASRTAFNGG
jgi:hypothetical protein